MLNSSEPQSADLLQITVCLRHWAFEEGIYDLIKSVSSPGNKTRTKGSSSCRTKLLSCHHGRTELFSLNSFREEPVDQCLWHPEFYRAECVLATPVQPQGIRWPSGGWNLRVEGLCTCAKMEAVGRGLREGGKSSQVKAVSSPGELRKQGRNASGDSNENGNSGNHQCYT